MSPFEVGQAASSSFFFFFFFATGHRKYHLCAAGAPSASQLYFPLVHLGKYLQFKPHAVFFGVFFSPRSLLAGTFSRVMLRGKKTERADIVPTQNHRRE